MHRTFEAWLNDPATVLSPEFYEANGRGSEGMVRDLLQAAWNAGRRSALEGLRDEIDLALADRSGPPVG